jgi:hypothetical protein
MPHRFCSNDNRVWHDSGSFSGCIWMWNSSLDGARVVCPERIRSWKTCPVEAKWHICIWHGHLRSKSVSANVLDDLNQFLGRDWNRAIRSVETDRGSFESNWRVQTRATNRFDHHGSCKFCLASGWGMLVSGAEWETYNLPGFGAPVIIGKDRSVIVNWSWNKKVATPASDQVWMDQPTPRPMTCNLFPCAWNSNVRRVHY